MSRHGLFTKEQLAKPFNLSLRAINVYVANDLLFPINLSDGIMFTASDMLRLEIIVKGQRLGYSLNEIKLLMERAKRDNDARREQS